MRSVEYFSIQFRYQSAPRGFGSLADGIHVQLAVDEDAENKLLTLVENVAYNAARTVGLKLHHQYSWPNGSCYKWATTETNAEFEEKFQQLQRILAAPWMSVHVWPKTTRVADPAVDHGCHAAYLNLFERIAGRPLYHDNSFVPQEPKNEWGGYSERATGFAIESTTPSRTVSSRPSGITSTSGTAAILATCRLCALKSLPEQGTASDNYSSS